jgi:alkylhydroperoxidase family enzyme
LQDADPSLHAAIARADLDAAGLAPPERALMDFVRKVTQHAYRTTDEDVQGLRDLGWTDPQVAECVYITALFAFFNRVADAFGLEDPNYFGNPPPPASQPGASADPGGGPPP